MTEGSTKPDVGKERQSWFCYMVQCHDGSFYVGMTNDVPERVKEHNWGVKSKFTAKRRPVRLVWWQEFATQVGARKREVEIKGWSRRKKLELIRAFEQHGQGKPLASLPAARGKGE